MVSGTLKTTLSLSDVTAGTDFNDKSCSLEMSDEKAP